MNPLNLDEPPFLLLYVPLLVLTFIGSVALRRRRRLPGGAPLPSDMDLPPYQMALLVGRGAALEAVVASLVHSGALELHDGVPFLSKPLPKGAHPLEDALHSAVSQGVRDPAGLRRAVESELQREEAALRRRGLLVDPEAFKRHQFQSFLPMALVLALGIVKVGVEMQHDGPVGLLVLGAAIASVIVWSGGESRLSRRGDAVLAALRRTHQALRMSVGSEGAMRLVSPGNMALTVGLYGTPALASSQLGGLRAYLQSSPAGMSGSSLDGTDLENSYNSYSDYRNYGSYDSTDSGGGGDGGGGSDGGGRGGGGD
jgi:uncharacterized protein (TIGR04222 family)